jgi:hypothetical protein
MMCRRSLLATIVISFIDADVGKTSASTLPTAVFDNGSPVPGNGIHTSRAFLLYIA